MSARSDALHSVSSQLPFSFPKLPDRFISTTMNGSCDEKRKLSTSCDWVHEDVNCIKTQLYKTFKTHEIPECSFYRDSLSLGV